MLKISICLIATLAACSAQEVSTAPTKKPTQPVVDPVVEPPAVAISFASVQFLEDCPDPPSPPPAAPKPATMVVPPSDAPAASQTPGTPRVNYVRPCLQSTLQVAFASTDTRGFRVSLNNLRLLSKDGATLGAINARSPSLWNDNRYQPWDQNLAPSAEVKASYKLSIPDWTKVQTALGISTYAATYILEADIVVGDTTQTVRSAQFARQKPQAPPPT